MSSFVDRFGLWSEAQQAAGRELAARLERGGIDVVRFSFADQHGILRGKTLVASEAIKALRSGVSITTTLLAKDTSHRTVFPVFTTGGGFDRPEMQGAADILMVADPCSFKVLPWAPNTGWLLCETYFPTGAPVPFDTRQLLRKVLGGLTEAGYELITGLEVECHVFKVAQQHMRPQDAGQPGQPGVPPDVELLSHGYQYLTELRYDAVDEVMELVRTAAQGLDLPLRSLEVEFGPSQFEFTFAPDGALRTADNMVLLRSAVKQVCRRHGFHATFMCRPRIPNVVSSGWHLHQSLRRLADGGNAFMPQEEGAQLSPLGMQYLAGLLEHARGAAALSTPTINGYKRYRSYSLAPDRAIWGRDNRGVMLRVLGGAGDAASRIENRVGEPAANPYLYFASQVLSGLDGINGGKDPGPSADAPYETKAEFLPTSLAESLQCLRDDDCLRKGLGEGFVDYFCHIKEAELLRFNQEVSEWEHREYFDMF